MRVVHVNLRLAVVLAVLAMAGPAHAAAPISSHAMVHTCCTASPMKERVFSEASELGAAYVRVDVEMSSIFEGPGGTKGDDPDWDGLDEVTALSKKYDMPVLGILLAPPAYISTCPGRWPDSSRCAAADTEEFGALAGKIAAHAGGTIRDWEIVNEPDGEWAFEGTAEQYAAMLSAAYGGIKARAPDARVVLGGLMRPHEPGWLERVFATPGADAIHKFDVANVHLRGPVDAIVRRYGEFKSWLAAKGFSGPLWVTEHGYPADPAFQTDRAYAGGDPSQAAYLTQTLVGLGEAGAEQVFVTQRDNLEGEYASEGLEHIDETPGYPVTRRASFAAVKRLVDEWDQVMAWRALQRENEREQRIEQAKAAVWASEARTAREKFHSARLRVHASQDQVARPRASRKLTARLTRRLARTRALLAGRRTALLLNSALANWHSHRADERALAVAFLKQKIAGG
jgi:hypothetical protein